MKKKEFTKVSLIREFLKGSKRYFIITILFSLFVSVLDMLPSQIIRVSVDSVIGNEPLKEGTLVGRVISKTYGAEYFKTHLWILALAIIVIAAISTTCGYINRVSNTKGAETLVETMRNMLFSHIQKLPFSWHMKNQTGDIIQRCTSDVDMVRNFIAEQLIAIFRIVILIAVSVTFMFSMNVKLTVIALICIPIIVIYSLYFHSKFSDLFMECDENEGILSAICQENLTGVRVVRAFGRENFEKDRFEAQNKKYTNLWVRVLKFLALFWGAGDFISGVQVMLIIVFGVVECVNGNMTAGEFIAFVSYNAMLVWPVRQLGRMVSEMSKAGVSIERIRYIMNSDIEKDKENACTPDMLTDICFDHVSFGYNEETEILHDVSFTIKKGTTFGILGGTGSGKSTLMYLMNRLYDLPEGNGKITFGGVDVADMKAEWVRSNVGMVLQEPFLFSRTIKENIGITKEELTLSDIREAARIACVDDAISEFSKGYDTMVGERGVTLSGGQKQRTAIARMLTQKTPVMVFDDSLSAVDAETDAKIREALKENLGESTVILISHRITTLMQADCILVLDDGKVAELGSHEELLA
ncbi:MAG: ABC transporter ATP-binding protein, partial [Lachnospiraceae bacterium]|nr:ABC transporter ATP-binding protein [Lachnospiraceae bacterium]